MTALDIANDFRASACFACDDEVDLFKKLYRSIEGKTRAVFIEETHGATKYNVEFSLTTGAGTRCEIADLLIISKSGRVPFLRATFWQAKKQRNPKWVSIASSDMHVDFTGQFNQWDLLSRRPHVSGILPFQPPGDLLSCFDSASIGSFGIFYERASKIEIIHSVAELIGCTSPKAKHPKMVANAFLEKYFYSNGEVLVRTTLESFLSALLDHEIGAPVQGGKATHRWLISYAKAKVVAANREVPNEFFDGYDVPLNPEVGATGDGISLLLIDNSDTA